ncbi:hypothetical protein C2S51_010323 [Perilla frutescens var. frutescens]|nr:hypothetical protein C2S51_010323 [Perilla frutescens var. frutescens]
MAGRSSDEETSANVSRMNASFQIVHLSTNDECDDISGLQEIEDYKQLSYKLFQYRTYKPRGSNGEFRCQFCANYDDEEEEEDEWHCTRLLLHAIRVAEHSDSGKERANHSAMAKYLAFDLADEVIAEAQHPSSSKQRRKKPRLDHQESTMVREMEGVHDKVLELEREHNEMSKKMNDLIQRARLCNDELQGARAELIKGLNDILRGNHVRIGIKNVGEIDSKVFITEMEKRFSSPLYAVIKGVELCSLWQEKLANPQWYPFQVVEDDNGRPQRLLNEGNISLQELKKKWGQEIHDAVVEALNELHECNPSGCCVIPELWNFEENRKAKLDEVIKYVLEAVRDFFKVGNTSNMSDSRIKGQRERGDSLKMGSTSCINDSDEESCICDPEIYEHKERIYKLLKSCTYKVRGNNIINADQLSCPFCFVEQEHDCNSLLRHALTVAENSSESAEQRASHFALARYIVIDLPADAEPSPQDLQHKICRLEDEKKEKALKSLWKENEELKRSNADLLAKEQRRRDELRRVRKELAKGLIVWQSGKNASIGIKKMGEIDVIPFKKACKKRFSKRAADYAADLCHMWQEQIKNPDWQPFRFVGDDKGKLERLLNNDDEQLRALKQGWGDEVYNAVIIALKELNEYSPRKRRTVPEIWNFNKNRKAKMEEAISFVFAELMAQKQQLKKPGKTATQLLIKS